MFLQHCLFKDLAKPARVKGRMAGFSIKFNAVGLQTTNPRA
ncbi:MAG: hypothetical protein RLZZ507_2955 [Cyanobacteriota bacterium]|jgi:hypothetical protein